MLIQLFSSFDSLETAQKLFEKNPMYNRVHVCRSVTRFAGSLLFVPLCLGGHYSRLFVIPYM